MDGHPRLAIVIDRVKRTGRAMRVLMTADPGSVVWDFVLDLVAGLGGEGVEVVLATLGTRLSPAQRRDVRVIPNVLLAESDYKLEWMPEPWEDIAAGGEWLLALGSRYGVDVVHCNHLVHANLPWGVPVLVVGHSCVLSWWEAVRGTELTTWARYGDEVHESLGAANAVVAPSQTMLDSLEHCYGPLGDAAVIHSARRPMPHTSARKESHIFAAGRLWDDANGLAALGRVGGKVPWPIHVAGATQAPSGARATIPDVDLLGALTPRAMSSWFRRSAIFVAPAKYEPSALTVLDAARAGCALVLGDIPSLRELWDDAALFVPPDDDAALADALNRLATDTPLRTCMARASRTRASAFSYERCVREYLLAYRVLRGGYERLYEGVREAPYAMPHAMAHVSPGE
jgi:glycosyltransferase involved in cell wall biosynthesis